MSRVVLLLAIVATLLPGCKKSTSVVTGEDMGFRLRGKVHILQEKQVTVALPDTMTTRYAFDEAGNCTELLLYRDSVLEQRLTVTYEGKRQLVGGAFDADGNKLWEQQYEYENDTLVAIKRYAENELTHISKVINDEQNRMKESHNYDAEGNFKGRVIFEYDDAGNIASCEWYDAAGHFTTNKIVNTFDADKCLVMSETYDEQGGLVSREYRTHNKHLDVVLSRTCDSADRETDRLYSEYEYDKNDNWVKRTLYRGEAKDVVSVVYREIIYY